ncbi:hypothetical protein [Halopiger goleimassiliensis]|uniref:hypothetical protein n=1 Tax=Halopiger goleimassiliensis TaxID=1293048 RepID=UPI000AD10060|nr:hypothetical protein [Halopiger goleimassiliensis]
MPVDRLLPGFLQRESDSAVDPEAAVLHECRHCGSKFDEAIDQCPVCEATEIATYQFPSEEGNESDGDDARDATDVTDATGDDSDATADEGESAADDAADADGVSPDSA